MVATANEERRILIDEEESPQLTYSSTGLGNGTALQATSAFYSTFKASLAWQNINVFTKPAERKCWSFRKRYDSVEQKQLLHNVSGKLRAGELLAIMGASGAGKTTLLNVLTCRNLQRLDVEGEVLVNGVHVGAAMTRLSAYVQQDYLFIGTLTVREHLEFQALLKMEKHLPYKERMKRVNEVIVELGLVSCANTVIGNPGRMKGISGGEMKRLAFAAEVLTNPSLMFCDEPTSGLDSFMSQSIVSVLKGMAAAGRTIVCTIHQPSSVVYEMFETLLLMAEGRVAYMGPSNKVLEFFKRAGLHCPVNYNPADFFIHNLAIIPGKEKECRKKILDICFLREKESRISENITPIADSIMNSHMNGHLRYKASWCKQFIVILKRSWISLKREPVLTRVKFLQSVFIAFILGLMYLHQHLDEYGIMNINGALFLMLTNITFQNCLSVVNVFCLEQPIFLREHWNGMYRADVYFLSKTLAEVPMVVITTFVFTTIFYWMVGLNSDYQSYLYCLLITVLVASAAASFGYMISSVSSSLNVALSINVPLMMPLLLFGGFYLNNASIPIYFVWIKYLSWFFYGYESLVINQWSSIKNITCDIESACATDGRTVLKILNFDEANFCRDIGLLVVLLVFYRLLALIALLAKSRRRT